VEPEALIERVQGLTAELESLEDAGAQRCAEDLVAAVVDMYGAGLERIMTALEAAPDVRDALLDDGVVASLLLIHDLYPVPLEERVAQALDRVRPYMESHGGDVELLAIENGVARLRLEGSCSSCSASQSTLELAVRQALEELAPDLDGMDVEGLAPEPPPIAGAPLPMANGSARAPAWFDLDGLAELQPEQLMASAVSGTELLVANVDGTLLAYRNECADCGARLEGGQLVAGALSCPSCGRSYFLPRAGRSLDDDHLQLAPIPLLRDNGSVRVALAT
jgi:Fe-S cluster biogenesis protein NfuA/nitrite reductase/ring-hydroxylating ferredoxin subunit